MAPQRMNVADNTILDASLEQAKACAEKAVGLLVNHRVIPIPRHYAVTYQYCMGNDAGLNACIDKLLTEGKLLDEYLLRDLHERFVDHEQNQRYSAVGSSLQNMLANLVRTVQTAGSNADEYRHKLLRNIAELNRDNDPDTLIGVAQDLLAAAVKANTQAEDLQHDLEMTRAEVEQLRNEIELHRREALIDPLTGLFNRRAMEQLLGEQLEQAEDLVAMLVMDIDFFKKINDSYGHSVGDIVLRHVAEVIRKSIRGEDIAVRFGGEEFVILLPRTSQQGAMVVAETLRRRIEEMRLVRRNDQLRLGKITASLGVALRRPEDDQESLFSRADQALYISKSLGRNRVTLEAVTH